MTRWYLICVVALLVSNQAAADTVDELVAQVSQAQLSAHIDALAASPRFAAGDRVAAAAYIQGQLEGFGYTVTSDPFTNGTNLIARKNGVATPDEVFVLGAHYDTVNNSPGADDDASGVATMLEVARLLADVPLGRSVEFVAFDLEEAGLLGSTHRALSQSQAATNVIGMFSLEMISYTCSAMGCQVPFADIPSCLDVSTPGLTTGSFIAAVGNDASLGLLWILVAVSTQRVPSLQVETAQVAGTGGCFSDARRSDHAPYWDQGYPALMITDTANFRNPNYHTVNDTPATLDLAFATEVTQALVATVVTMTGLVETPVPLFADRRLLGAAGVAMLVVLAGLFLRRGLYAG